jgi:hypothetical protein
MLTNIHDFGRLVMETRLISIVSTYIGRYDGLIDYSGVRDEMKLERADSLKVLRDH